MHRTSGFTLIGIVMVLVLLGILTAVAVPKYFDLQAESEKLAAQTAVAEAQARIHAQFSRLLLTNVPCVEARNRIKDLSALADAVVDGGARFGEFVLTPTTLGDDEGGTSMSAGRVGSTTTHTNVGKLLLPSCADAAAGSGDAPFGVSDSVKELHSWMVPMITGVFVLSKDKPQEEQSPLYKTLMSMEAASQITETSHPDFFGNWPLAEKGASGGAITKNADGSYEILVVEGPNGSVGIVSKIDSEGRLIPDSGLEVGVSKDGGRYVY